LKAKSVELNFQHIGEDSNLKMDTFTDASFGNLSDGGTQGGHFIVLMGDDGGSLPFHGSQRELRELSEAHWQVKHSLCLRGLIMPFFFPHSFLNSVLVVLLILHL
ncbi:hypothetical protein XENORESO_014700, partial [Xenotaenia resolanae]